MLPFKIFDGNFYYTRDKLLSIPLFNIDLSILMRIITYRWHKKWKYSCITNLFIIQEQQRSSRENLAWLIWKLFISLRDLFKKTFLIFIWIFYFISEFFICFCQKKLILFNFCHFSHWLLKNFFSFNFWKHSIWILNVQLRNRHTVWIKISQLNNHDNNKCESSWSSNKLALEDEFFHWRASIIKVINARLE